MISITDVCSQNCCKLLPYPEYFAINSLYNSFTDEIIGDVLGHGKLVRRSLSNEVDIVDSSHIGMHGNLDAEFSLVIEVSSFELDCGGNTKLESKLLSSTHIVAFRMGGGHGTSSLCTGDT